MREGSRGAGEHGSREAEERGRQGEGKDVFNLAYTLAMEVFRLTIRFPKEERYALVIRCAGRLAGCAATSWKALPNAATKMCSRTH
jgi:hypothetical protein